MKAVDATIAGRYARALAELIGDQDVPSLEKAAAHLDLLARVLRRDPGIGAFFSDPSYRHTDKKEAAGLLAEKVGLSDLGRRFLDVLVEHGRVGALPAIATHFALLKDQMMGILPAEATVAVRLSEGEVASFTKALETMTGRRVRLSVKVDPAVIGGARTQVGSQVYDGTIRGGLEALHRRMAEIS
jgi:F-type H+-transporting ATPase subunit delta